MRNILSGFALALFLMAAATVLAGCSKEALSEDFAVTRLFSADGCTVYRFHDLNNARYFWKCAGANGGISQ